MHPCVRYFIKRRTTRLHTHIYIYVYKIKCLRSIHCIIDKIAMLKCHMDKNPKAQNGLVAQGIMKYHEVLHSKESYCSSYIAKAACSAQAPHPRLLHLRHLYLHTGHATFQSHKFTTTLALLLANTRRTS